MNEVIKINGLIKDYYLDKHTVHVLKGITLHIQSGEYVALMGPSGSGKSTLMNIVGCLDTATSGDYILNGNDISRLQEADLAQIRSKEIGFVFQQFNLLPRLSALDNVALPLVYAGVDKKERHAIAKEKLALVELADRWDHKPNELSGGQCQRVAIARALVNSPSIILADEPTGNLDSKTSSEIMNIFESLNQQGNTIILVTHEEDIAEKSKRIIRLRDGLIESSENNVRDTQPNFSEGVAPISALKEATKPTEIIDNGESLI